MEQGSLSFIDHKVKCIYIAKANLPCPVSPELVLAQALNQLLGGCFTDCAPLVCLVSAKADQVEEVLNSLRICHDVAGAGEHRRGVPGEILLEVDMALVQFRPLHPFMVGEIIAWQQQSEEAQDMKQGQHGQQAVLRYGRVLEVEQNELDSLRRLRILLNPSTQQWQWLLTSDVYSFRPCGATKTATKSAASDEYDDLSAHFTPSRNSAHQAEQEQREKPQQQKPLQAVASGAARLPVDKEQLLDAVHDILAKV
jgi:hypothetical protein